MKVRTERKSYTCIPNEAIRDKRLSLKARGLLVFCLSLPDTWEYSIEGLMKVVGAGRDCIRTALQELENSGYLTRHRARDEKGRLGTSEYVLYDTPQTVSQKPETPIQFAENSTLEKPTLDFSTLENPQQINKDLINKEILINKERERRAPKGKNVSDFLSGEQTVVQEQAFEKFWEEYPRRVNKTTTRLAWRSLPVDEELYNKIFEAVAKYRQTNQWQDINYVPYPENFLMDERWEDEIPDIKDECDDSDDIWGRALKNYAEVNKRG